MEFFYEFFQVYLMYFRELWLTLAVGFLISGFFFKFIPTDIVEKHLGEKGLKPIFISSIIGTLLPVCCIGALPIAITLRRKGATLGSVLAFMVATPATSISALIVCWKLLGLTFTAIIFFGVIVMAILMGIVTNGIKLKANDIGNNDESESCCHKGTASIQSSALPIRQKIKEAILYAFVTLPKEIGLEVIVGIAIASFVTVFEPIQYLISEYLTGLFGYFFVLIVGLVTYVCSTASVPMADAFMKSGLSHGQALCYLLVGPVTSYGTILIIKKDFGWRVLSVYLGIICSLSLIYGLIYDMFY
ncbi:MAG: permease [Candidatus Omnitrophica bacterium]|nr:permease [Candidatus Omnitrophota bacterium]